ncbi:DUF3149 domain-containing protein [Thiohalobacter sp. IOR34]|nr:DUF3149 domain-containing protein [Thiohalobacter sp. IOR34]WJW76604.1 DUF3149 domain-containing protein [Thiohalobacter sp. IOR34]
MKLLSELFGNFTGLLSLFVVVFIIGMAIFLFSWFIKNSQQPPQS